MCTGNAYKRCDQLMVVQQSTQPPCIHALFIAEICKTTVQDRLSKNVVLSFEHKQYLISSS